MKIIKMIKVVSFSMIVGGLVSTSAYAQDMDVTMDVVKQSDAQNITERVMRRIDLPESAQHTGTHGKNDQDRLHRQDQTHMREDAYSTRDDGHQMQDDAHGTRDDSYEMRDDANSTRDDSYQMRDDANSTRDDSHQMRDDAYGARP